MIVRVWSQGGRDETPWRRGGGGGVWGLGVRDETPWRRGGVWGLVS